jgi:hypothetical protein
VLNIYWFGSFVKVLYHKLFVNGGYVVADEGEKVVNKEVKAV